jgi:hypothetical protein
MRNGNLALLLTLTLVVMTIAPPAALAAADQPVTQSTQNQTQNRPGVGPSAPTTQAQGTQANRPGIGPSGGATAPLIYATFPSCIQKGENSVVTATVTPPTGWSSVRVYFRRIGTQDFYYLEMRSAGDGQYWAVLPKPEDIPAGVEARVAVKDADGRETTGPVQSIIVTPECKTFLSPDQWRYSQNLVVGETATSQQGKRVLEFLCDGIISRIDAAGQLRQDNECRKAVIAAAAGGSTGKFLVPLGIGLVVGGGAVAVIKNHEKEPASPICLCNP